MRTRSSCKKKRRIKLKKNVKCALIFIILVFIFVTSTINLVLRTEKDVHYENPDVFLPPVSNNEVVHMLDYMEKLYNQNSDIVGYIHIEGTNIDGPVLYKAEDDYYLSHGFDKQNHIEGSFFVDKYNSIEPRDDNLIIHGHNMNNGSMFHDLVKYKDKNFYLNHQTIRFDSLYETAEYEIVAAFVSQVYNKNDNVFKYYKEYNFENEEEFLNFWSNIKQLSIYDTGVDAKYEDEFITLSTCEYSKEDGRMVVIARKK